MKDFIKANRELWDAKVGVHKKSEFYDIEGFLKGNSTLDSIEVEEIGEVVGKSLLHLQCHFGLDTLSWSRLGADVVGVDFSRDAIALANEISNKTGITARFIQSDIYELHEMLDEKFDIVFTSGGVLCWLHDMKRWLKLLSIS